MAKQTEPKIGDTRIRYSKAGVKYKETLIACVQCGKGRWQVYRPINDRPICRSCSLSNDWKNPELRAKHLAGIAKRWAKPNAREIMSGQMKGENNHFYGKKHTEKTKVLMGKPRIKFTWKPTRNWGYLIGLVLGDGSISKTTKNHKIAVASTQPEIVDKFYECCQRLKLHCCRYGSQNNGESRYVSEVVSKRLYLYLRPYKSADFNFTVPDMVYRHETMLRGFLRGFYDAEGGVYKHSQSGMTIECWSKHLSNLIQIQDLLHIINIRSTLIKEKKASTTARLTISEYDSRVLFRDRVGFDIMRKQTIFDNMKPLICKTHSIELYNRAISMREAGYMYREIETQIGVNRNTITGWWLRKSPRIKMIENNYSKKRQEALEIANELDENEETISCE